jgi:hypothetical protein
MELDKTNSAWWKSNTTNDYETTTLPSLHTKLSKCIIYLIHVKRLVLCGYIVHKVNPYE